MVDQPSGDWKFAFDQMAERVCELRDEVRELRRELRNVMDSQGTASIQSVKLLAEHDICRTMVLEHERSIKELQKFKIQIVTIAATVQLVAFALSWFLQKLLLAGVLK